MENPIYYMACERHTRDNSRATRQPVRLRCAQCELEGLQRAVYGWASDMKREADNLESDGFHDIAKCLYRAANEMQAEIDA